MNCDIFIIFGLIVALLINLIIGQSAMSEKPAFIRANNAILFEMTEIMVICFFIVFSIFKKEIPISLVLLVALLEHIRQIVKCTRMSSKGNINTVTIIGYSLLIYVGIMKKEYWISILMTLGVIMHLLMLLFKRPFISRVCWEDGKLVAKD